MNKDVCTDEPALVDACPRRRSSLAFHIEQILLTEFLTLRNSHKTNSGRQIAALSLIDAHDGI